MNNFREIDTANHTNTIFEQVWLLRLSIYKFYYSLGFKEYRLTYNREARKLQNWRTEFNEPTR